MGYSPVRGGVRAGILRLNYTFLTTGSHSADKAQHHLQTTICIRKMDTDTINYIMSCKCEIRPSESMSNSYSQRRISGNTVTCATSMGLIYQKHGSSHECILSTNLCLLNLQTHASLSLAFICLLLSLGIFVALDN